MIRIEAFRLAKSLDHPLDAPDKVMKDAQRSNVTLFELLHAHIELTAGICAFEDNDEEDMNLTPLIAHNGAGRL